MNKNILVGLIFLLILPSCIHNKIRYLQDKAEVFEDINEYANEAPNYKIQKNDILYIKIASTNEEINKYFNSNSNTSGSGENRSFYLDGFNVNDNGFINLQIIGDIKVDSLTVKEAQKKVQNIVNEFLKNANVTLKLVSFKLTFLGEINNQGEKMILQDNINILEGIALAGGINDYGDKRNVLIVRNTSKGSKTFRVDLTKRELLESPNFYLLPNDIIIIEPLKNKSFRLSIGNYTTILSTITSTITLIVLLINLNN